MPDLVGKVIADYQIVEIIDDAARSVVYKGFQSSANQYVAVKVLKPRQARDQASVQAFSQYAERASAYRHPNILPVLDIGKLNGANYLVTPYLENRSVADHLAWYTDSHQIQVLFSAMLPGLEFIYDQGYVHGNLRPTNIMLDPQGRPLLADFGMPFRGGEAPTPYNSPEQAQGGFVDQRTDVYALGIILFELLSGQAPYPGMVINLQSVRPDLKPGLEQVILKATAQNPEHRYQTPREFNHACANALQTAPQEPAALSDQPEALPLGVPYWVLALMGVMFMGLFCLCTLLATSLALDYLNLTGTPAAPAPTQTQQVQDATPTLVVGSPTFVPTQMPSLMPTQMPTQPLATPMGALPTQASPAQGLPVQQPPAQQPPAQQPPAQQPPAQQPPEQQPPEQQPAGDSGSTSFPVCGSLLGFAGAFALMGGAYTLKRRGRSRPGNAD